MQYAARMSERLPALVASGAAEGGQTSRMEGNAADDALMVIRVTLSLLINRGI
jgi:hypothetical protein